MSGFLPVINALEPQLRWVAGFAALRHLGNVGDIVTRIKAAGAPIDAFGAQAHAAFNVPTSDVQMYIDKLAATGLRVFISEYDCDRR